MRGATIRVDPTTGGQAGRVPVLVKARGAEVGARVEGGRFSASLVGFSLALGSELVFSGDGGTTEATHRYGTVATLFWRPTQWLTLDGSAAFTHARFHGVAPGKTIIPNAIGSVIAGGAAFDFGHGLSGALRLRHFGSAPLIKDGSARPRPTTLVNAGAYYRIGRVKFGLDLLNELNARDHDITRFYARRLAGEQAGGADDYHLQPVEPRQVRGSVWIAF